MMQEILLNDYFMECEIITSFLTSYINSKIWKQIWIIKEKKNLRSGQRTSRQGCFSNRKRKKMNFESLEHPPSSQDLISIDFYLFPNLRENSSYEWRCWSTFKMALQGNLFIRESFNKVNLNVRLHRKIFAT